MFAKEWGNRKIDVWVFVVQVRLVKTTKRFVNSLKRAGNAWPFFTAVPPPASFSGGFSFVILLQKSLDYPADRFVVVQS